MGKDRQIPLARRYRLLSVVGRGGMGTVWRAYDQTLDREVAVKEVRLPEGLTAGERRLLCRRTIEEGRATAALHHPGVVAVHDLIVEDGRPWIVMEFVRARSLRQVIADEGSLPPARVAEIGRSVLAVLRAAHAAGILHRDVKPSNVMLCEDGRVLLTDFGLAAHADPAGDPEETLVSGIEGSPAYLAPERVRGEPGTEASDLWSLGATLYAAVEGRSPFLRCHPLATMVVVLLGEYPRPVRAGALAAVIDGLLRTEPGDRFAAGYLDRLLREASELEPAPVARARWRRPRIGAVVSIATLAAMVIMLGAWTARWNSVGQGDALTLVPVSGSEAETVTHREPGRYTVDVPAGWTLQRRGDAVEWRDPRLGSGLRVKPAAGDPLERLREAEREAVREGAFPGYRLLRLEPMPELSENAAEWEFTWGGAKVRHGLVSRAAGYEFSFFAPDAHWTPGQRMYDRMLKTFRSERAGP
ncbi:serine/threonine-protein kinase [Spirillospora sp. CA-294931]|uniref:serine/threonine-protein kinase n=1 Tax=Spirillospora sp. CA-294931 TaxID=3240042 RepID=UPI003D943B0F